jgi:hypothetical protein
VRQIFRRRQPARGLIVPDGERARHRHKGAHVRLLPPRQARHLLFRRDE